MGAQHAGLPQQAPGRGDDRPMRIAKPLWWIQHDDGQALRRLEDRIARLIGEHIGGRIAEENSIDEPFCRQLARVTDPCAQPADKLAEEPRDGSYLFWVHGYCPAIRVQVTLYNSPRGEVALEWIHPAPPSSWKYRSIRAATVNGIHSVAGETTPEMKAAARGLLTGVKDAWGDYLGDRAAAKASTL